MNTPETHSLLLILQEACRENGYTWRIVDHFANNLVEVSNTEKSFFASNSFTGVYPTNPHFAAALVNDKAWTNMILQEKGFRVINGEYFFVREEMKELRGTGKERSDALSCAQKIGYPVFVKPNKGSLGVLAEVIYNEKLLIEMLNAIADRTYIALIQERISLPEYRIFVVDGVVEFVYQRGVPSVIGDGKQSVRELIKEKNKKIKREQNLILLESIFLKKQMKEQRLSLNSVMKMGQKLPVSSKNNLGAGGDIVNYSEEVSPETAVWAASVAKTMNLHVCGIDVFVEESINFPNGFQIIEINQNPSLTGIYTVGHKQKALDIWRKVLQAFFG